MVMSYDPMASNSIKSVTIQCNDTRSNGIGNDPMTCLTQFPLHSIIARIVFDASEVLELLELELCPSSLASIMYAKQETKCHPF